ncbi:exo-beta-N-acetylmuramidase NamZ family protein [Colwellia psychrerythraea]|uniref:Putative conserved protein UCP016719 n=1 Tax=Colwellia psychrerythraea TaxID=28229 RepID=A0A099KHV0_COLPS|nr:DUF1343 domain-containing protein [Colwellia psychrerythraea]KGJ89557.1 putative conserved protein UCP016719 [Colwellia psychrerythraea]
MKLVLITKVVATFISFYLFSFSLQANINQIVVGAEQVEQYLPELTGKRVGLVVNQTSAVFKEHLVDVLLKNNVDIKTIFAPEHGFRGNHDAGEKFDSSVDSKTGIPLISLYGKNRKPTLATLKKLDVIVFDIQDVGVRFYTYISTMHYMMEAAADAGIKFIVLDRPNPNGAFVDGPVLEKEFRSFVGMHTIPLLHGMTVAELAQMIKGEGWLTSKNELNLSVYKVKNYQREMAYHLPKKPSPNLPNAHSIALYPSLAFFEATPVSIGRGTPFPFQVIGHDNIHIGDFRFTPVSMPGAASNPKFMNVSLQGEDLREVVSHGLDLRFILRWYNAFAKQETTFFSSPKFMDKLAGTDKLRKAIMAGQSAEQIKLSWRAAIIDFMQKREPYLLYP